MRQNEWTVKGVMAEYDALGKLSRRKKAFMKKNYLTAVRKKQIEFDRKFYNYLGDIKSAPTTLAESDLSFKDDENPLNDPHLWRGV